MVKSLGEQQLPPESLLTMKSSELMKSLTEATPIQKLKIIEKVEARQKLGISMLELEQVVHQGYGVIGKSNL